LWYPEYPQQQRYDDDDDSDFAAAVVIVYVDCGYGLALLQEAVNLIMRTHTSSRRARFIIASARRKKPLSVGRSVGLHLELKSKQTTATQNRISQCNKRGICNNNKTLTGAAAVEVGACVREGSCGSIRLSIAQK